LAATRAHPLVCFSFPAKYVEVAKTLDHEIAASSMGKKK
jgi:hypothetical protein